MGEDLKVDDGSVTLQIKGDGPLGAIMQTAERTRPRAAVAVLDIL
jgi:redox-regulated HSP33 family molecular chaperone